MGYTREDYVLHPLPSGVEVFYRDADHAYFQDVKPKRKTQPEGEWSGVGRLTGVSTVVKPFDFNPEFLLRWAARTNGIGIAQLVADQLDGSEDWNGLDFTWLLSAESIWRTLTDHGLTFSDLRDQRAIEGTNVHKHALHALAMGEPVPRFGELTDAEGGYARGIAAFWLDHDPVTSYAEQVVADVSRGVAGRFDWAGVFQAECGDVLCPCHLLKASDDVLLDAKTSGFIGNAYHVQLAGYEHCAQVSGLPATAMQLVLQVDENGGYRLVPSQAGPRDFLDAIKVYRRAAQINNAAEKERKQRQPQAVAA